MHFTVVRYYSNALADGLWDFFYIKHGTVWDKVMDKIFLTGKCAHAHIKDDAPCRPCVRAYAYAHIHTYSPVHDNGAAREIQTYRTKFPLVCSHRRVIAFCYFSFLLFFRSFSCFWPRECPLRLSSSCGCMTPVEELSSKAGIYVTGVIFG